MTRKPRAAISWSGGKDSCAALHRTHFTYDVVAMVTMCDETAARSRSAPAIEFKGAPALHNNAQTDEVSVAQLY